MASPPSQMESSVPSSVPINSRFSRWLKNYWMELKSLSMTPSAWVLIFYSVVLGLTVEIGFSIPVELLTSPDVGSDCFNPSPESLVPPKVLFIMKNSLFCILYPFSGWFSDIVFGRKKALSLSLWLCWFGTLLQCVSYCIQYGTCGLPVNIAKYGISGVAFVFIIIGNAGLFTNIPALGIDQLFDMPHTHSQAFVYWTVWGLFLGFIVGYIGFVPSSSNDSLLILMTGLSIFVIISTAIVLHNVLFHRLLQSINYEHKNPYKLVYFVLKHALVHDKPQKSRSAFTYWENSVPSRIDLGKQRYGGPFLECDVEDVKSFLRFLVVFAATFGYYISYYNTLIGALFYVNQYHNAHTIKGYGSFALWEAFDSSIILVVPLLQWVVLPLMPKLQYFMGHPLVGLILCYVFQIISLFSMVVLEYFNSKTNGEVSFLYFSFPLFFSGLTDALTFIFGLELISSQAPSSMKGMLIGYYWFIRTLYSDIGCGLSLIHFGKFKSFSSDFWGLLLQLVICITGLVCFIITARWYKARRRGDNYNLHIHVEDIYNRSLSSITPPGQEQTTTNIISL